MKILFFFLSVLGLLSAVQGETLVTKSGKKFYDYKITESSDLGVKVVHRDGINMVILSDLPDNVAQKYSADLKTKSGNVYEGYSVTRVSHNKMKITHKFGSLWIPHDELPEFLLEKYADEIREKKKKSHLREQKQSADREKQRQEREISEAIRKARETGNDQEAVKILQRVAEAYPQHNEIGQVRIALSHRRDLLETRKKIEAAYSSLTWDEAICHLEGVLKLTPNNEQQKAAKSLKFFKEARQSGYSPIQTAALDNNIIWLDKLLAQGADINDKSKNGSLLMLCLANSNLRTQMLEHLLSRKADVNLADDKSGKTPLMIACQTQPLEVVKKLVQSGALVNQRDFAGDTPLHFAMSRNDDNIPKIARYLISQGAKTKIANKRGRYPEDMLSNISDRRVRYEMAVILKNISFPSVIRFATFGGGEGSVNWNISISELRSRGYRYNPVKGKPGFDRYSNDYHHYFFSQKTGRLAWVIFNDTSSRYSRSENAKQLIDDLPSFCKRNYGRIELGTLPERSTSVSKFAYWFCIVPYKGTFICSFGHINDYLTHQIRVLNPAYFPTDGEYIREIYDQL